MYFPLNRRFANCFIIIVITIFCLVFVQNYQTSIYRVGLLPSQEIRKFAFMRNHKCGSTTIENIIFRFAYKKQLNLVMPAVGNYLSTVETFNHNSLQDVKWKNVSFDIFTLHNRWNRNETMIVLKQEVPTFAIVRNPVDVFVSMFHFLGKKLTDFYGVKDIHEMVHMIQFTPNLPILQKRWSGFVGRNQMAWDMGLPPKIYDNQTAMQKEIERLDTEFDLVMIAERMDESLILLKELLHWPLENLVHLDLNRRKSEVSPLISVDERNLLAKWLSADVQIFEHFSRRLDERIAKLNKENSWGFRRNFVEKETRLLKEENKKLYNSCVTSEVGNEKLTGKFKEYNNNILGYVINEKQKGCDLFALSESAFLEIFRKQLTKILS